MKKLFFLLFIVACSTKTTDNIDMNQSLNFDKNLSFSEFIELLNKYNEINDFAKIDK